jgi:hypothetical protein
MITYIIESLEVVVDNPQLQTRWVGIAMSTMTLARSNWNVARKPFKTARNLWTPERKRELIVMLTGICTIC